MRAAYYNNFKGEILVGDLEDPHVPPDGVIIKVKATGICMSDWHGWQGHDPDIKLPHVPGHELAGEIAAVGKDVNKWHRGERVTLPFVCGCGSCPQCNSGNPQICDFQFQPGFTDWGSFAELVAIDYADQNLVRLPDRLDYTAAASLGCRFITAFRAVLDQGRVQPGQWLTVYGCGGVGLAAIMIGNAVGAKVLAIDITQDKLALAKQLGALKTINSKKENDPVGAVREITQGGAHVSLDAVGNTEACINSIKGLRKRGRHIQVGLLLGDHYHPPLPMEMVIANELEIVGSHGMPAFDYQRIFKMMNAGKLDPGKLVTGTVNLDQGLQLLQDMQNYKNSGVHVINEF